MRHLREIALFSLCACGRLDFEALGGGELRLTYPSSELQAVLGRTMISLLPTATGAMQFSVSPALPAGVTLDPGSGVISGTPLEAADQVDYVVTGTAASGTVSAALELTVLPGSVVDSTMDAPDDDEGVDGVCFATAAGGCTLRAAVQTANHRTTMQLVLLDAGSYALGSALDAITNDVEIAGQGASNTSIRAATSHPGFGLLSLAASRRLRLIKATFRDFGPADGAVIHMSAGALEVDAATFTDNVSGDSGGVLFIDGGATARLRRSTFIGNFAVEWGGVIDGEGDATRIVVDQCTALRNSANWGSFSHITTGTTLLLQNSTLYENRAMIAGTLATPGGVYTLVNDTIVYNTNTSPDSAGIYLYSAPCSYTVANTIIAFNTDARGAQNNCNRNDLSTAITSRGGNILGDGAGNCASYFAAPGDRLAMDPGLDPAGLTSNGGPTMTVLLTSSSTAIDAAETTLCPAEDQRGLPRPDDSGHCDVGAVEMH